MKSANEMPQGITVVLIEDDEIDVMGVRRAFQKNKLHHKLMVFTNGLEALSHFKTRQIKDPYLVLLDLNTPRMSGAEFLSKARQDPDLKKSIIFVLTTSKDPGDIDKAYQHNVAGYIVKGDESGGYAYAAQMVDQYARSIEFP